MRRKISKDIDLLILDKEVGYFPKTIEEGQEPEAPPTDLPRKKKRAWNRLNHIQKSRRTAILRKVRANEEVN